ncbi:MAG TPA: oxygenase MpaB family protein [Terracidiphilus sp.]|nr:oxygenase MpaB family protein [Terracidiphilus sp.]
MPFDVHPPEYVSPLGIERLCAAAAAVARDPAAGLFGPESITWRIDRESALFLGAGRAALLQLAHPWVTAALVQHSNLLDQPVARFHNTFRVVFTMVFGTLDQALAAARHLYQLHTGIRGELREDTAGWSRGTHYEANEIAALRWVFSTLVESAVMAYECVLGPLGASEREQYYAESKRMAALFGIPASALPENWQAFRACNHEMHASDELGVSAEARRYGTRLLAGAGSPIHSWIHPPLWYRALTVAWLPERFRSEFSFDFGEDLRTAAESAARRLPGFYRRLPDAVRFVGPYHEARARLRGRSCGILARLSNRFWIGEPRMPFSEGAAVRENDKSKRQES